MIALKIEQADALREGDERYDAMLDAFEPGMTTAELEPLLERAARRARAVRPAGARRAAAGRRRDAPALPAGCAVGLLDAGAARALLRLRGGPPGPLHAIPSPGGPGATDVRLTTRVNERLPAAVRPVDDPRGGPRAVRAGQNPAYLRHSIGRAPSLGLHESQSRFYEHVLGGSEAFWEHMLPIAREHFPTQLEGVGLTRLRARAQPRGGQRDPRERRRGDLQPAHPGAVRARARADPGGARGRRPARGVARDDDLDRRLHAKDDVEGVMQDIHWSWGELGYFPTYTLGNLYSAALAEAMRRRPRPRRGRAHAATSAPSSTGCARRCTAAATWCGARS